MQVCTKEDDFIYSSFEYGTRWIVELSNGERVFQDDDRPGLDTNSAWIRLGQYIKANSLNIINMRLQFRSHVINVNDGPVEGFFFSKSVLGSPGMEKSVDFYVAGTLKNGILRTKRWQLPDLELDVMGEQVREVDKAGECLILNQE